MKLVLLFFKALLLSLLHQTNSFKQYNTINIPITINDNSKDILAYFDLSERHMLTPLKVDLLTNVTWICDSNTNIRRSLSLSIIDSNMVFNYDHYHLHGDLATEVFSIEDDYLNFSNFVVVYTLPSLKITQKGAIALSYATDNIYSITHQLSKEGLISHNVFSIHFNNDNGNVNETKGTLTLGDESKLDFAKNNKQYHCNIYNRTAMNWNCYMSYIVTSTIDNSTLSKPIQQQQPLAVNSIVEFNSNQPWMYVPLSVLQHVIFNLFNERVISGECYEISHKNSKELICHRNAINDYNEISFIIEDFKITLKERELFANDTNVNEKEAKFIMVSIKTLNEIVFGLDFIKRVAIAFDKETNKIKLYNDKVLFVNNIDIDALSSMGDGKKNSKSLGFVLMIISCICICLLLIVFFIIHYTKEKVLSSDYETESFTFSNTNKGKNGRSNSALIAD